MLYNFHTLQIFRDIQTHRSSQTQQLIFMLYRALLKVFLVLLHVYHNQPLSGLIHLSIVSQIGRVSDSNAGLYVCVANNALGSNTITYRLNIGGENLEIWYIFIYLLLFQFLAPPMPTPTPIPKAHHASKL